jgi:hypothetical protein
MNRPPTRPGGAHAPIPSVPVAARRRGAIPGAPVSLPRRPVETADDAEQVSPTNRQIYTYRGNAGVRDNLEIAFRPLLELEETRPVAVLFHEDPAEPQPATELSPEFGMNYLFDSTLGDGGQVNGTLRFNTVGQTDATQIYVALIDADTSDGIQARIEYSIESVVEVRYGASWIRFQVDDYELQDDGGVGVIMLTVTPLASDIDPGDGAIVNADPIELWHTGKKIPNAAVFARVRYWAGKSEVVFDCDWAGGFIIHADRIEISRVTFPSDPARGYLDGLVNIAATLMADAPSPAALLQRTIRPELVTGPTGTRTLTIPRFARRVNLIMTWDDPGDVPLGQVFLAWAGKTGPAVAYIDAMAAREALFGQGLPVPYGVSRLVLSNRSADSMELGVVWQMRI